MPLASSRSSIEVPSYPCAQNRSMIRSSATPRSTSGRRPMPASSRFETDRSTKNETDQSHSGPEEDLRPWPPGRRLSTVRSTMCDYCDCRSEPEIAALSADHDRLIWNLHDLSQAAESEDHGRLVRIAADLRSRLDQDATREEQGLFAQLRAEVGDAYVDAFTTDHERIHSLVAAAAAGDVGAAKDLDRVLRDHILLEESDLFPAAHQLLSPAQWDAVAA